MIVVLLMCGFMMLVSHPMMMVGGLITFTVMVSMISYFLLMTFWFGNLIMLVILSGMLVVFTYMASLSPKSGFFLDYWGSILFVILMSVGSFFVEVSEDQSVTSVSLWMSGDGLMNLFSVVLLFLAMLAVVWVGSYWSGPVRV